MRFLAAAAASLLAAVSAAAPGRTVPEDAARDREPAAIPPGATAGEILSCCRAMLPDRPVEMRGRITRRNRKGIVSREFAFSLLMDRSKEPAEISAAISDVSSGEEILKVKVLRPRGGDASVEICAPGGKPEHPPLSGDILGTDVTWMDLTLDFLWWTDASLEAGRDETVHGIDCLAILAKPPRPAGGVDAARVWVDRKTGCMMQAEQLASDGKGGWKPLRRLWGTRIRKFPAHAVENGVRVETKRWMASAVEVQRSGGIHRTKISIESVDDEPCGAEGR